jgi:hypothetical protein
LCDGRQVRVIASVVVVLGLALPASTASGASPAEIERARASVLTESYQKQLPGY